MILFDDFTKQYQASHIDTFNPKKKQEITIQIIDTLEGMPNEGEEHIIEDMDRMWEEETALQPEIYDFSEGKEYGTVLISREWCGAIKY